MLNWESPQAKDLMLCTYYQQGTTVDLTDNHIVVHDEGSRSTAFNSFGFDPQTNGREVITMDQLNFDEGGCITCFVQGNNARTPASGGRIVDNSNAAPNQLFFNRQSNDLQLKWKLDDVDSGIIVLSTNIWDGLPHILSIVWPPKGTSSPHDLWIDGTIVDTFSSSANSGGIDVVNDLSVGNRESGGANSGLTHLSTIMYRRRPSNGLIQAQHSALNRFDLFRQLPEIRQISTSIVTGGGSGKSALMMLNVGM